MDGRKQKLVTALFSLARRLAPTVIFIDEIDTLLKRRGGDSSNNPASASLGLFMSEWDGLQSSTDTNQAPIVLIGATNRPEDVDAAFRRRMPLTIQTIVPDEAARSDILRIYLKKENLSDGFSIAEIAAETDGFTGAELKELCRLVSLARLKAAVTQTSINGTVSSESISLDQSVLLRPLTNAAFGAALHKMKKSGGTVNEFSGKSESASAAQALHSLLNALSATKPSDENGSSS